LEFETDAISNELQEEIRGELAKANNEAAVKSIFDAAATKIEQAPEEDVKQDYTKDDLLLEAIKALSVRQPVEIKAEYVSMEQRPEIKNEINLPASEITVVVPEQRPPDVHNEITVQPAELKAEIKVEPTPIEVKNEIKPYATHMVEKQVVKRNKEGDVSEIYGERDYSD
jgi:hypothetical protein